ncbi:MAG: C1 family peptidase [Pirellulales bacterium]|nr:C1 family peptidase [Pirellulales bacterium]
MCVLFRCMKARVVHLVGFCVVGLVLVGNLGGAAADRAKKTSKETSAAKPAATVDLRPKFAEWNLPARAQGKRPTCSVFVVAGALEYAIARREGRAPRLSVEYLNWASNQATGEPQDGSNFENLWKGFRRHGACAEERMPYRDTFDSTQPPSPATREAARRLRRAGYRLHWIKEWNPNSGLNDAQLDQVRQTLRRGWPVCGGFLWPKEPKWADRLLVMPPREGVHDGHSVLLVGYRDDPAQPGGGVFLIHNSSAGPRHGQLSYAYLRAYMNDAAWIEGTSQPPAVKKSR